MPRTPRFDGTRLRQANQAHGRRVEKFQKNPPTPEQIGKLQALRKRHLDRLRVAPFFNELLRSRHVLDVRANGRSYRYSLLLTGFEMNRFQRPVVVLLDSVGRKLLFYKSTGVNSGLPNTWLPFNAVKFTEFRDGTKDWWYQKFNEHPTSKAEFEALPAHIRELSQMLSRVIPELVRDKQMVFKKHWDMDQIAAINQML